MSKIDVNVCYKIAFDAMSGSLNLEQMVGKIRDYIQASVMITEVTGQIVFYASALSKKTSGRPMEKWITTSMYDYMMRKRIHDTDYYSILGSMVVINAIVNNGYHWGYCIIIFEKEYEEMIGEYSAIADVLSNVVANYCGSQEDYPEGNGLIRNNLVNHDIFYGTKADLQYLSQEIKGNYIMAYFSEKQDQNLLQVVQKIWPCAHTYTEHFSSWVLFYDIKDKKERDFIIEKLKEMKIICCVSALFSEMRQCRNKTKWLRRMNQIRTYNRVDNMMLEGEWYTQTMYTYAWNILKDKGLNDYVVQILQKEDEEKNTELYETLKMYCLCGNNIAETASMLYVHRNTLVYRLKKIRELIGSDIDDMERSEELLAFMMMNDLARMEECLNAADSQFTRNI